MSLFQTIVGFIAELFKQQGYKVEVGKILQGNCVSHEIDVIAVKENQLNLMECKYRNQPGVAVDVKTPLYIKARFEDVLDNKLLGYHEKEFKGWVIVQYIFKSCLDIKWCFNINRNAGLISVFAFHKV